MATKKTNNSVNNNVKVFDTVNNEVKTQNIEGQTYLIGKEKEDGIHLIKADGKRLNGCYENKGNILVECETKNPVSYTESAAQRSNFPTILANVSGMTADDKLSALANAGKADGFVKMTNADGEGSIWRINGGAPVAVDDKEIEKLLGIIVNQDYIHNMRIDRSWILPQMKSMLFDPKTGRIDTLRYRDCIKKAGMGEAFRLLLHNLKKMMTIKDKDPKAYELYMLNWNYQLAKDMVDVDMENAKRYVSTLPVKTCSRFSGLYRLPYVSIPCMYGRGTYGRMFFTDKAEKKIKDYIDNGRFAKTASKVRAEEQFISDIWNDMNETKSRIGYASNLDRLINNIERWIAIRIDYPMTRTEIVKVNRMYEDRGIYKTRTEKQKRTVFEAKFPESYISAYKADGAYYSMRTLLRYYGDKLSISKQKRNKLLSEIESWMREYAGEGYKLFGYMLKEFFPTIGIKKLSDIDQLKK